MRTALEQRKSNETDIKVNLNLDGTGKADVNTGIGFFDHMLTAMIVHGGFDAEIKTIGDLNVDCHHTIEDTGIVLGRAFAKCLGDKSGIERFASFFVPMDEALAFASVDISGRPYLVFDCPFTTLSMGEMNTDMVEEFFRAFAFNAGITLHIKLEYGKNDHHKCEAVFKAVTRALRAAVKEADSSNSTKGLID